jgi:hypothetical protein
MGMYFSFRKKSTPPEEDQVVIYNTIVNKRNCLFAVPTGRQARWYIWVVNWLYGAKIHNNPSNAILHSGIMPAPYLFMFGRLLTKAAKRQVTHPRENLFVLNSLKKGKLRKVLVL